jgi:ribokinase
MASFRFKIGDCRYQALIGVGGIGSGVFFALDGDHTLGREESRSGRFLDRRDYCKLHIISHYVKALLGPEFATIPIGKVGDDDAGHRLLREMEQAGLDMRYVESCPGQQTLAAICLIYPDGSGGNLTVDDSACTRVDESFVAQAELEFARFEGRGVALAAPEVPLAARAKLLQLGTAYRFLRVASFISAEMGPAIEMGMLDSTDLLAINVDEAAAAAGISAEDRPPRVVVESAIERLRRMNPTMWISITAGKAGSWSWDGESLVHVPAFPAQVVNTAGAGDAHLSGMVAGLVAGLPLSQAQELGTLTAALSVTSPHTIAPEIERRSLRAFAAASQAPIGDAVRDLLEGR